MSPLFARTLARVVLLGLSVAACGDDAGAPDAGSWPPPGSTTGAPPSATSGTSGTTGAGTGLGSGLASGTTGSGVPSTATSGPGLGPGFEPSADAGVGVDAGSGQPPGVVEPPGDADAGPSGVDAGDASAPDADAPMDPWPATPPEVPPGGSLRFPQSGAVGVCRDAPLRVRFAGTPRLGSRGSVRVYDMADPSRAVATLDMGRDSVEESAGGETIRMRRRAHVDGDAAVFYLPNGSFEYGHSYRVALDEGVLLDPAGASYTVSDAEPWTFSVTPSAPAEAAEWKVAQDETGDFCTIQGALDALSPGRSAPITLRLGAVTFHETLRADGKSHITLQGVGRERTTIAGVNNENMNGGTKYRALVGFDTAENIVVEDLTIHNQTPQGGSQAEALRLQRCDQCVVRRVNAKSLQDTLLLSGRVYAEDCYVEGNVDYVWGTGTVMFERCEFRTVGRNGYLVQSRNDAANYGYVFVDCKLTSDPGVRGDILARIELDRFPDSHVAFIDTEMGSHIDASGWVTSGFSAGGGLRFWEYGSRTPSGGAVNVSRRLRGSRQISEAEAAQMRDPSVVLRGWDPR